MHMHRFQLIAAIVIGLIVAVLIVVIPLANKDNTDLPLDDNNEVIEAEEKEPNIPSIPEPVYPDGETIVVRPSDEDKGNNEEAESDEPPIGEDNVDLDVSVNTPPEKNPDPSASAGDVIYGEKGEGNGE
jgi:hypothetical protein